MLCWARRLRDNDDVDDYAIDSFRRSLVFSSAPRTLPSPPPLSPSSVIINFCCVRPLSNGEVDAFERKEWSLEALIARVNFQASVWELLIGQLWPFDRITLAFFLPRRLRSQVVEKFCSELSLAARYWFSHLQTSSLPNLHPSCSAEFAF